VSSAAVNQRYVTYAELAKRWGLAQARTAARIVRRQRPTAIFKLAPRLHRVALRDVLDLERAARSCGSLDLEGL
jgi:hypothetical protein